MESNQVVKTFVIKGQHYDVVGCRNNDTEGEFDFYDVVHRESGETINEGDPFESLPEEAEVLAQLEVNARVADAGLDSDEYIPKDECVASGRHLASCDDDGYCDFCGEQDE